MDQRKSSGNVQGYTSETNLVPNGDLLDVEVAIVPEEETNAAGRGWQYYTLPTVRFSNFVKGIIFLDGILSAVLWLAGGHTKYFVDNITHFHLRESVFDLALMAALKTVLFVPLYILLEDAHYKQIDHPFWTEFKTRAKILHALILLFSIAFLAFSTTKGGLILYSYLHDSSYTVMHATYIALVISAVFFSLLEFILSLWSLSAMRNLQSIRQLHRFSASGKKIDKDGNPVEKKVDLLRLASLAKPELRILLIAAFALVCSSAATMVGPLFFGKVIDTAQKSMGEMTRTVLILLGIYFGGSVASVIRAWIFTLAGQRLVARLRKNLFNSIIKQEVAFFDTNRTGELCNRLASDTQVLQNAVTVNLSMLSRYLLQIVGSLALMFYLNAALTGILLAVVPVVSFGAVQYGQFVKRLRQQFQDRLGDAGTQAEEALSSIRTVRMFSGEPKVMNLYGQDIEKSYNVGKKLALAEGAFQGVVGFLAFGAVTMVLWYGGKLVYNNTQDKSTGITPGVLTSFLLYTLQVAMAFALLSSLYGEFMQALGASLRIFKLMDRVPTVPNNSGDVLLTLDGNVGFENVRFTYPSRPETEVLKSVSFTVNPGQMVALVGPSGGGKSTIVSLIERFYDTDSGRILLGGHDLKTLDPHWFRQKISMVSQEPCLFACSIKDNIAYGRDASLEEIEEAAKQANAHEFILGFEDGYDTLVGERGVRLSGGQKQRIAIARALIMDPVLLLLDEATSALDAESEHLVQEAIDRAMEGRTVIVIAHRLSTVRNASQVIVIERGTIAEKGTHEDLINTDGVYKRLVLRQIMAGEQSCNKEEAETTPEESLNDNNEFTAGSSM